MSLDRRAALLQTLRARPATWGGQRVRGVQGWDEITPTRHAELVADQLAHLPFGSRRGSDAAAPVRAGVSGSGDSLLVLTWTEHDLARERAAGAQLFRRLGLQPGMRVANALAGALVTPGALLVGDVVDELGALDVPLGEVRTEAAARSAWALVDRVEAQVLILDAASAAPLFAHMPAKERPWWTGILWLDDGNPGTAPANFTGWQRRWIAVPQVTSFVAGSCDAGHYHAGDDVIAECVDGALTVSVCDRDDSVVRFVSERAARTIEACACGAGAGFALA